MRIKPPPVLTLQRNLEHLLMREYRRSFKEILTLILHAPSTAGLNPAELDLEKVFDFNYMKETLQMSLIEKIQECYITHKDFMDGVEAQISIILNDMDEKNIKTIDKYIASSFQKGKRHSYKVLGKRWLDFLSIEDQTIINQIRKLSKASLVGVSKSVKKKIEQELIMGMLHGESIPKIVKRLRPFLPEHVNYQITRIVRTEVMRAANKGLLRGYKENKIKRVEFIDGQIGACEECGALDGSEFPIDHIPTHADIPIHPQCRCCWGPVT